MKDQTFRTCAVDSKVTPSKPTLSRRDLLTLAAASGAAAGSFLTFGCGGGGGGGGGGSHDTVATRGTVSFPGGIPAGIQNGLTVYATGNSAPVASDGTFTLNVPASGLAVVLLVDANGRQLMAGFSDTGS